MVLPSSGNTAVPTLTEIGGISPSFATAKGAAESARKSRLGENQGKFIAAKTRRRVYFSTMCAHGSAYPAQCPAPHQMAMIIIDILESVQIEKQDCKGSSHASVPLNLSKSRVSSSRR